MCSTLVSSGPESGHAAGLSISQVRAVSVNSCVAVTDNSIANTEVDSCTM